LAGIYIHIPFCKQACSYCNFHFSTSLSQKDAFINALQKEIRITANAASAHKKIDTIYFGGGTPSILSKQTIQDILYTIYENFEVHKAAEITLEANPDNVNSSIVQDWLRIGINRLSLGIQSFNDDELTWMNRAHNALHALNSIDLIQQAGFTNFSVDLIYGSPLLSHEELQKNIQYVLRKNIPHIACYALTVEEKTMLYKQIHKKKSLPIDETHQSEQFHIMVTMLEAAGYEQYEISNFAKPGYRSQHNSSYWKGIAYWGFGPSAHSFDGLASRRWNVANNALYIQSIENNLIPYEEEILTPTQQLNEQIMIGLRTMEGISLKKLEDRFGIQQQLLAQAKTYIATGQIKLVDGHLMLSKEGKFFADGIAADLFAD
jgi:oxygen-independent coproporphyrinogen-3 oxidase